MSRRRCGRGRFWCRHPVPAPGAPVLDAVVPLPLAEVPADVVTATARRLAQCDDPAVWLLKVVADTAMRLRQPLYSDRQLRADVVRECAAVQAAWLLLAQCEVRS